MPVKFLRLLENVPSVWCHIQSGFSLTDGFRAQREAGSIKIIIQEAKRETSCNETPASRFITTSNSKLRKTPKTEWKTDENLILHTSSIVCLHIHQDRFVRIYTMRTLQSKRNDFHLILFPYCLCRGANVCYEVRLVLYWSPKGKFECCSSRRISASKVK